MAYVIAQPCIGIKDTACVAVCPMDCIHPTKDESQFPLVDMLHIDPQSCIDCHMCVSECPVQAIFRDEDVPSQWSDFIRRNADYFNP